MCIIIYKPAGYTLLEETLQNSWDTNPHGAGFMYAEKETLYIVKGLMTYKEFKEAYEPHKTKAAVLHFRIATHGETNQENTHPFQVSKKLGIVHNGIMSNVTCNINPKMSDTWHFTEKIMKPLQNTYNTSPIKELIEAYIGFNKCVTMNNKGQVTFFNEKQGHWDTECWFSNHSYVTRQVYAPPTYNRFQNQKSNITPPLLPKKSSVSPKIGDWGRLITSVKEEGDSLAWLPEDALVELVAFGPGNYIFVKDIKTNKIGKTLLWQTELWLDDKPEAPPEPPDFTINQEIIFSKNYNHFRIGDKRTIARVTDNFVIIFDFNKQNYSIPKTHIQPIDVLFH